MTKTRLEAFSDGVIAIIITIMVLEIKMPHEATPHALMEVVPTLFNYLMSFIFIGIYWGNHHHLVHIVKQVSSGIIWANLNLLFWLSLIPFATNWMGEQHLAAFPVAVYAVLLNLCGLAYTILQMAIASCHTFSEDMAKAMNRQKIKGILSLSGYALSIPMAYIDTRISVALFILVASIWLIPDKSIEKALKE